MSRSRAATLAGYIRWIEDAALEPASSRRYDSAERKLIRFLLYVGMHRDECAAMLYSHSLPRRGEVGPFFHPDMLAAVLASEDLLCSFLAFSAMSRYAFSTVHGDIYAWRARAIGPGSSAVAPISPYVGKLLKGYKKLFPPGLNKRTPLSGALLLTFMEALICEETRETVHDPYIPTSASLQAAMLASAFVACLRVGEYTGSSLLWSDVLLSTAGQDLLRALTRLPAAARRSYAEAEIQRDKLRKLVFVNLVLRRTKASPRAPVRVTLWPFSTSRLACPVVSLLVYMAGRLTGGPPVLSSSPFFSSPEGLPVSRVLWTLSLRSLGKLAGLSDAELSKLSPHSLRGGGATAAAQGGAGETLIKALGRWRSSAVRIYINAADIRAKRAQAAMERTITLS